MAETITDLEQGWRLVGTDGDDASVQVLLGETALREARPGLSVGRHPALVEYVIADESVSRRHCRFSLNGRRLEIEDLNSLNGTEVDGKVLEPFVPKIVEEGMTIVLGRAVLRVEAIRR